MSADDRPIWTFSARPRGGQYSWEIVRLRAESEGAARGVLHERGMEVMDEPAEPTDATGADLEADATQTDASEDGPHAEQHHALTCMGCGYPLKGLRLGRSGVDCPECGHRCLLFTHQPPTYATGWGNGCLIFFASIGGAVFVLIIVIAIMSLIF